MHLTCKPDKKSGLSYFSCHVIVIQTLNNCYVPAKTTLIQIKTFQLSKESFFIKKAALNLCGFDVVIAVEL